MIYFIQHTKFVKIGYTKEISSRLNQLQVSCPVKLKVLGLIKGNFEDEANYQSMFKHNHSHGEWFHGNKDLLDFIEKQDKNLMWEHGFQDHEGNEIGLIKFCRKKENLTLEELGCKMGLTKQSIQNMEKRDMFGNITIGALVKALNALGYKYEYRAVKIIDTL
jgi:DNA-binding XRE family transcriptional regulator